MVLPLRKLPAMKRIVGVTTGGWVYSSRKSREGIMTPSLDQHGHALKCLSFRWVALPAWRTLLDPRHLRALAFAEEMLVQFVYPPLDRDAAP
jgi:hypothetical protein